MTSRIYKKILEKKKGVIAIEWTIVAPFIFLTMFASVMFLIFVINFYLLSNAASEIAQNLNMGDKGYQKVSVMGATMPETVQTLKFTKGRFFTPKSSTTQVANLEYTPTAGNIFGNSFKFFVNEKSSEGSFKVPYTAINSISAKMYDNYPNERFGFNVNKGETESGNLVVVEISYNFFDWIPFTVRGYSFII